MMKDQEKTFLNSFSTMLNNFPNTDTEAIQRLSQALVAYAYWRPMSPISTFDAITQCPSSGCKKATLVGAPCCEECAASLINEILPFATSVVMSIDVTQIQAGEGLGRTL